MNMKKRAVAFVICLFLVVALGIVYIFSELYIESDIPENNVADAVRFKEEYESLNNQDASDDQKYRTLDIAVDNPFVYSSAEEIIKKMDEKETFVVYFGFSSCPWCRSILEPLIESSKNHQVSKIYYVDVLEIRDTYKLDDNHQPKKVVEGSEGYNELLKRLDSVLSDYMPLTYTYKDKKNNVKTKEVEVNEKRIYAPNIVAVKDGTPIDLISGISELQTSAYMEITSEMKEDMIKQISALFGLLDGKAVCSEENQNC